MFPTRHTLNDLRGSMVVRLVYAGKNPADLGLRISPRPQKYATRDAIKRVRQLREVLTHKSLLERRETFVLYLRPWQLLGDLEDAAAQAFVFEP